MNAINRFFKPEPRRRKLDTDRMLIEFIGIVGILIERGHYSAAAIALGVFLDVMGIAALAENEAQAMINISR